MIGTVCSLHAGSPAVRSEHVTAAERWTGSKSQHQRSYGRYDEQPRDLGY
jgi:hypothetical protein